jgi:hypothetical protein
VHVVPDQRVGLEIAHANAENWIVLDAFESPGHEVFAVFVRCVSGLVGGGVAGESGETVIELSTDREHDQHAHNRGGNDQVKALAFYAEKIERDASGDDEVNKARTGSGHEKRDEHDKHSNQP